MFIYLSLHRSIFVFRAANQTQLAICCEIPSTISLHGFETLQV